MIVRRNLLFGLGALSFRAIIATGSANSTEIEISDHMKEQIDVDKLAVTSGGSGPPILFIHGFGSSKYTWRHICRGVRDIYTYYAIDLPGSGRSPAPRDLEYTLENYSDVITKFITKKNLYNLTLVGTSLGGGIALIALIRRNAELASRVKALCIIDGIAYPQDFPFFVGALRIPIFGDILVDLAPVELQARVVLKYSYFNQDLITDDQVREYASYLRRNEVRQALKQTARLIDTQHLEKYSAKIKTILVPSLLIWGREDRVVPLRYGNKLAGELPNSKILVIDRCGHMPQEECPQKVIAAIRQLKHASQH
jgi:pimeloyl-ACP methyl ester carboxylesterase